MSKLVIPDKALFSDRHKNYFPKNPLLRFAKLRYFHLSEELSDRYSLKGRALDLGCGEGFFIPTLSKRFDEVVAVDCNPTLYKNAKNLVKVLKLQNVKVIYNKGGKLRPFLKKRFNVIYCHEIFEHVLDLPPFFKELKSLLSHGGHLVFSVPIEVGSSLFFKEIASKIFGRYRESYTLQELFKASVLWDTSGIPNTGKHKGFDYRSFLRVLNKHFEVLEIHFEPLPLGPFLNRGLVGIARKK